MSIETGAVIAKDGRAIRWHLPPGRSATYLPDSQGLWDSLWEHREDLGGFAHSHPGSGVPLPSGTDVTTFAAVEAALGVRLRWWITSEDCLSLTVHGDSKERLDYVTSQVTSEHPRWLNKLRRLSYGPTPEEREWILAMAELEEAAGGFPGSLNREPGRKRE